MEVRKIVRNKDQGQVRKDALIKDILDKAEVAAKNGHTSFEYLYENRRETRNGLPGSHLTLAVETASGGTVCCVERGDYGWKTVFAIKEVD